MAGAVKPIINKNERTGATAQRNLTPALDCFISLPFTSYRWQNAYSQPLPYGSQAIQLVRTRRLQRTE